MKNISVIGSGGWGCALANLMAEKGHDVTLWSWKKEESDLICNNHSNEACLPGIKLSDKIHFTYKADDTENSDIFVFAVPSHAVLNTAKLFSRYADGKILVNVSKGFEHDSNKRLSVIIKECCPKSRIVVLSGPSHAEEVARGIPTTIVSASESKEAAEEIQDVFMTDTFRVYTHNDVIGVETGGALKNVIALCAGISDGLGLGDNTKAALMTRGLAEISRLGVKMGAKPHTFAGLSGIGDLIVTCTSMHSRNRRAGILIGQGMSAQEAQKEVHMVVEGVFAAECAYALSKKYNVSMPITEAAYKILFEKMSPRDAVMSLMTRDRKSEADENEAEWL